MKKLENCKWNEAWVSHMGCIKGCLDFLGLPISNAWLYGGTGHAFVINLHEQVCPSGPTAWKTEKIFELGTNLGYKFDGVFATKQQENFAEMQKRAWEHVQYAIDQGKPCYGWELEIPEFYVVFGYDNASADTGGYYFSGPGCDEGKGPKPWQELGDTGIGILEMYSVWPGEAADDATTVKQALSFALDFAASPNEWTFEGYKSGLAGYDTWINALKNGQASDMGMRFNTGVWLECRKHAAGFLKEANARLAGRAKEQIDEAMLHYTAVAENLGKVAQLYPWSFEASDEDMLPVNAKSEAAVKALQAARDAEAAGLQALEKIVAAL